jgi:hypothetical protein
VFADELGPQDSGVWLICTNGTRHVWDLDRRLFCRIPGRLTRAALMPFDETALRWSRVQAWLGVGARLIVWFDDPGAAGPATVEHFRASSTIAMICRLNHDPR